jgi:hypothetical protein
MPRISYFYGILIYMYPDDHNPPHFHAKYNEFEEFITIKDLALLEGKLPAKAHALVIEWASQHQKELMDNWDNMLAHKPFFKIEPLK